MKKLLTLFSAFVLGSGSAFGAASCTARTKHDLEEGPFNEQQDLEILNQIKSKAKQTFEVWWDTKATVDINDCPDQIPFFTELVDELKKREW